MSENKSPAAGSITWTDLTVPDAETVQDFYRQVVGWTSEAVGMGEYNDFNMNKPENGECVAGICHARGSNAGLPAQWLIYITVDNLEQSIAKCNEMGGKVIDGPRNLGPNGRMCVIEDPAGAVAALFEPV